MSRRAPADLTPMTAEQYAAELRRAVAFVAARIDAGEDVPCCTNLDGHATAALMACARDRDPAAWRTPTPPLSDRWAGTRTTGAASSGAPAPHLSVAAGTIDGMVEKSEPEPDLYVADVVGDGFETGAIVSKNRITARELTAEDVGKFIGFHTGALNYTAKISRVQRFDGVKAPGVSVWLRMPALPDGTPARDDRMHVQFDSELELIEMLAY